MLSCTCCHGNPARVNNRTCCTMGECNCACMPVQNPFGRSFSFRIPYVLFSYYFFFIFPWFPYKYFPWYNPFGFPLFCFLVLCLWCCVCVFPFCYSFFRAHTFPLSLLWFICLWGFGFFFKVMLLCFLTRGVQMQMPNEIISVYTASVPVILFILTHYWKKVDLIWPDWVLWWFQAAIKGCHLQCRVDQ